MSDYDDDVSDYVVRGYDDVSDHDEVNDYMYVYDDEVSDYDEMSDYDDDVSGHDNYNSNILFLKTHYSIPLSQCFLQNSKICNKY